MCQPDFVGIEHLHESFVLTPAAAAHEVLCSLMFSSQRLLLTHLPVSCLAQVMPQEEGKVLKSEVDPVMTHLDSILLYQEVHRIS